MDKIIASLLEFIKDLGETMETIAFTPYGQLRLRQVPRPTYYVKLRKFKSKGLLKKADVGGSRIFLLSEKAKIAIRQTKVEKKRTDGLSTIIIFDIPVSKNRERTIFRRYLKRHSFTSIQKSVLVSPCVINLELEELTSELKIKPYVTIISGRIDH